jgi:hypothetical protein
METWRHGDGDMEIETWKHGDMEMEIWKHGDIDMETWRNGEIETWRHGDMETWRHGDMDMETWEQQSENGKWNPRQFSLFRLPFAHQAVCHLSVC